MVAMRLLAAALAAASCCCAEVHTLTLRQAIDLALKQNPDAVIARLDEQKAAEAVREARDPFTPRLVAGSGLAYTSGFPMSINGSAPSILQAQAIQSLYNKPLSFQVAASRENARGASIDASARRDEVAHRVASMYLAAARSARIEELVAQQIGSFEKIADAVRARVEEGRELPVEARAAELRVALSRQRERAARNEREAAEAALAVALGFESTDRVRPVSEERTLPGPAESEDAAVDAALSNSKQLRRLESAMLAQQMQLRAAHSERWPRVDLVAQYSLMGRFNNFEEFFQRFQRHNGQLGMSFQLPLFTGSAASARAAQAEIEIARLKTQAGATRNQIALNTRRLYQDLRVAESAREVVRMDLDVTRERLGVALAQLEEGRGTLRQVEELRSAESEKWLAFYDAQHSVERARLELLRQTGTILAALP
jgi:outer membrane protein